jgi:hypothetical protein
MQKGKHMPRLLALAALPLVAASVVVSARPYAAPNVVQAGTSFDVVLQVSLDTDASEAGDRFSARVLHPVIVGGKVAVPSGAFLHGHVLLSDPVSREGHRGRLILAYDQLVVGGRGYAIRATSPTYGSRLGTDLDAGASLRFTLDRDVSVRPARST